MTVAMRARSLFGALAVTLVAAAPAPAASPPLVDSVYRFQDTLSPSYGSMPALTEIGDTPSAFENRPSGELEADYFGPRVWRFTDNSGLQVNTAGRDADDYTIELQATIGDLAGTDRLIEWPDGGAVGLEERVLTVTGATAVPESNGNPPWAAGDTPFTLTVRRAGTSVAVFLHGVKMLTFQAEPGEFELGGNLQLFDQSSTGILGNLSFFRVGLPDELAGDAWPSVVLPVTPTLTSPSEHEGDVLTRGRPSFRGELSRYADVTWSIEQNGLHVRGPFAGEVELRGFPDFAFALPGAAAPLASGDYTLVLESVDLAGRGSETELPFVVDADPPTGLTLDASTPAPHVARAVGRVELVPRDESRVSVYVRRPGVTAPSASFAADVRPDRTFAAQSELVGLAPGEYDVTAVHRDLAGNEQTATRRVTLAGPPGGSPPPSPPGPPPPGPPLLPRPPAELAPSAVVSALTGSLRRLRLRDLLRGARIRVPGGWRGRALVQIYSGRGRAAGSRARRRGTLVAQGRGNAAATLTVRATRAGRRLLRRRRSATLTVRMVLTPAGRAATTADRALVLRR
jgi:hypothetical protein